MNWPRVRGHPPWGRYRTACGGKTEWSAWEVVVTAEWLDVPVTDLMPEVELLTPGGDDWGASGAPG